MRTRKLLELAPPDKSCDRLQWGRVVEDAEVAGLGHHAVLARSFNGAASLRTRKSRADQ